MSSLPAGKPVDPEAAAVDDSTAGDSIAGDSTAGDDADDDAVDEGAEVGSEAHAAVVADSRTSTAPAANDRMRARPPDRGPGWDELGNPMPVSDRCVICLMIASPGTSPGHPDRMNPGPPVPTTSLSADRRPDRFRTDLTQME